MVGHAHGYLKPLESYGICSSTRFFVIAEIGLNHGGDIVLAKKIIDSAVRSGAQAVKFQTYTAEKRVDPSSALFPILKKCELSYQAFSELKAYCDRLGIVFFSTPFDLDSAYFLVELGCDLIKISSFDLTNRQFLKDVSKLNRTVFLSTGMSNLKEIDDAYTILKEGNGKVVLLHCVSAYPTKTEDANLSAISTLQNRYPCLIGQSDHTDDIRVSMMAAAMGAQVLEKHFRVDEQMDCVDAAVSISESQMKRLTDGIKELDKMLGDGIVDLTPEQEPVTVFRRKS